MKKKIKTRHIDGFADYLRREERGKSTIEAYTRNIRAFSVWMDGRPVTKEAALAWKEQLMERYSSATVNVKLASLNAFFKFMGWEDLHIRSLRRQRKAYRGTERDLTREDYGRLYDAALGAGKARLALLMETMVSLGIRVSEVRYITVEAARKGEAVISLKGKIRTILLPARLCRKLLQYAEEKNIASGEIFVTGSGRGMDRRQIWSELKALCQSTGVAPEKVFPHNFRHLFARAFYRSTKDIVLLSDVLGHASIETTRVYLISTDREHTRALNALDLVS